MCKGSTLYIERALNIVRNRTASKQSETNEEKRGDVFFQRHRHDAFVQIVVNNMRVKKKIDGHFSIIHGARTPKPNRHNFSILFSPNSFYFFCRQFPNRRQIKNLNKSKFQRGAPKYPRVRYTDNRLVPRVIVRVIFDVLVEQRSNFCNVRRLFVEFLRS